MRLPDRAGDYFLRVRLNYRHLPPVLLDKIGIPRLKHLLEVGIQMLFWLTPIIYTFDRVPEWVHMWFRFNPMVSFVVSYQDILYLNQVPSSSNWGLMILIAFGSLTLGYFLFARLQRNMEDYL